MENKTCPVCKKEFSRNGVSFKRWEKAKFCSRSCTSIVNKKFLGRKGPFTDKTRKKMSDSAKKRPIRSGEHASNWRGGKPKCPICNGRMPGRNSKRCGSCRSKMATTPALERLRKTSLYKIWRIAVFERDCYTCVWCLVRGGKLNADHIKPFAYFPELRFAIDNGRTLCEDCHRKTETFGARVKNLKK